MLGRTVAIKVIHPHLLGDEQTVARFYTEARASSRLNHPNSVSIIDFGRSDDGILYLAMEFLKGYDLATVMQNEGPLPFTRIIDILTSVLDALAACGDGRASQEGELGNLTFTFPVADGQEDFDRPIALGARLRLRVEGREGED